MSNLRNIKLIFLKITIYIIFILISSKCYSQIYSDFIKYWHYRDRLKYFVIPGEKQGESQICCVRNRIYSEIGDNPKNVDYGQHGKYTGLYISVLATEYYLLNKNGQYADEANTHDELYKALYAVKKYWDEEAEIYWEQSPAFNGFFIRGNVPCDFLNTNHPNGINISGDSHLNLLNSGLSTSNPWL